MPRILNPEHREFLIWQHDQLINRRGVYIDEQAVRHAMAACEVLEDKLTRELRGLTAGVITSAGQVKEIATFCGLPDCTADTVEKALAPPVAGVDHPFPNDRQRRVLEIRRTLSKASVGKLKKMLLCRNADGRVRGLYQYHGAHTGRPAGRAVQPTNLPRPQIDDAWLLADMFRGNRIDEISLVYEDLTFAVADALRSLFTAAPGYELYAGDFSAIEAVVTAGIAGEQWKLDAFRSVLEGKGFVVDGVKYDDVYCAAASKILQRYIAKKVDPEGRQIGKMGELAFGFGGGVGAWHNFDPDTKYDDDEINGFKEGWRDAHPMIKLSWRGAENSIIEAMFDDAVHWRGFRYEKKVYNGLEFLDIVLLNGKRLHYLRPKLGEERAPWCDDPENPKMLPKFYYAGMKPISATARVWSEHCSTYGGKVIENIVQAMAREIQMQKMLETEYDLKLPVVMHTYDEIVAEVPKGDDRYKEFLDNLGEMPDYAPWPIGVDGWRGERNRK